MALYIYIYIYIFGDRNVTAVYGDNNWFTKHITALLRCYSRCARACSTFSHIHWYLFLFLFLKVLWELLEAVTSDITWMTDWLHTAARNIKCLEICTFCNVERFTMLRAVSYLYRYTSLFYLYINVFLKDWKLTWLLFNLSLYIVSPSLSLSLSLSHSLTHSLTDKPFTLFGVPVFLLPACCIMCASQSY